MARYKVALIKTTGYPITHNAVVCARDPQTDCGVMTIGQGSDSGAVVDALVKAGIIEVITAVPEKIEVPA